MSASSPYIPGHYLLQLMGSGLLPETITRYLEEHLKKTGLDPLQLDSARLSPQSLEALLLAWPEIQSQSLAVDFGNQVTLTSQGNLSLLIMTAPRLRDALTLHTFLPLLSDAVTLEFFETPEAGHIQIIPHSGSALFDELLVLYGCAALCKLSRLLTGHALQMQVNLAKAYRGSLGMIDPATSQHWQADALVSSIAFPLSALDLPSHFADDITHRRLVKDCEIRLLRRQNTQPLVTRLRQLISTSRSPLDQESVASALNMSRSTLKRQLARENTSFQTVLTDVRKEQAVRLLLGTTLSLEEIAEQLGYSDQTNFSHAFRQWSGFTPGQYRKHSQ